MNNNKVKPEDLIGDIKDFPIEIVQKMCEEQVHQGNKFDVTVFQKDIISDGGNGGFDWSMNKAKYEFWKKVIVDKYFDEFFKKYPKVNPPQIDKDSRIYIRGVEGRGKEISELFKSYGCRDVHNFDFDREYLFYYISPSRYIVVSAVSDSKILDLLELAGYKDIFLPEETAEFNGKKYNKSEFEKAIKDLKPLE